MRIKAESIKQLITKIEKLTDRNYHNDALIEGLIYLGMVEESSQMEEIIRSAQYYECMTTDLINQRHKIYQKFWKEAESKLTKKAYQALKAAF